MYQRQVSFQEAIERALKFNYCNFDGRASRSEFWWFALFSFIVSFVIGIVFAFNPKFLDIASGLFSLAMLLPSLGLSVRRLHDVGMSGWWILLSLIPLVGAIILLVWFCKDSVPYPNEYGPVPNVIDDNEGHRNMNPNSSGFGY